MLLQMRRSVASSTQSKLQGVQGQSYLGLFTFALANPFALRSCPFTSTWLFIPALESDKTGSDATSSGPHLKFSFHT